MARFRLNTPGVKSYYRAEGTKRWLRETANAVASEAKRIAPVDTGAYRRSIVPTVAFEDGRWIGRVNAFDWKALMVEDGTHGIRKSRVLGTALDVVGSTAKIDILR